MSSWPLCSWIKILLEIFVMLNQHTWTLRNATRLVVLCFKARSATISVASEIFCWSALRLADSFKKKWMNWSTLNQRELTPFLNVLCRIRRRQVPTSRNVVFSRYEHSRTFAPILNITITLFFGLGSCGLIKLEWKGFAFKITFE